MSTPLNVLSKNTIFTELMLSRIQYDSLPLEEMLTRLGESLEIYGINEDAEETEVVEHLRLEVLDVEKFVKVNDCKCVSNPRAFDSNSIHSRDGLLSNEIFGNTAEERSGIYGYIDLHGWFIDPSCYKTWCRLDTKFKKVIHGTAKFRINDKGQFEEDENGDSGIEFVRKNMKKIKFKKPTSRTKNLSYRYLEMNRDNMFINKFIVIPPFYRDKNSGKSSRVVGLGGINKLYTSLIVAANALLTPQDFGFEIDDALSSRVQEIMLNIYDWFSGNNNKAIETGVGAGMSGKLGILRRTNLSKTANFSTRLVISAPELKVEKVDDMIVDFDHSAVPLYSLMAEFRDFVMFHTRRFFENEFLGAETYPVLDKNGNMKSVVPDMPEVVFSDERIKNEIDRFIHGYNNRFAPIEIPVKDSKEVYYMKFKGVGVTPSGEPSNNPVYNRRLTWCDVFYIATVAAVADKQVLITRFPIDFFSNQITTKIVVSSTIKTERAEVNGEVYDLYPYIREKDIESDTSNVFVDTLRMSNAYLSGCGGDKLIDCLVVAYYSNIVMITL